MLIVACAGMDRTDAVVSMHEKDGNGCWKQVLTSSGFVGKNGLCPDADHWEGCARTPIGGYCFNKGLDKSATVSTPEVQQNISTGCTFRTR